MRKVLDVLQRNRVRSVKLHNTMLIVFQKVVHGQCDV